MTTFSISFTVNLRSHSWENAAECKLRVSPRFQTLAYLFMKILIFLWKLFQPEVITLVGSLNRELFLSLISAFYYNSISYCLYTNCVLSGLKFDETGLTTSLKIVPTTDSMPSLSRFLQYEVTNKFATRSRVQSTTGFARSLVGFSNNSHSWSGWRERHWFILLARVVRDISQEQIHLGQL